MTTIRRYLDALGIAVAAFWLYARPAPRELEIVEDALAETIPQPIPSEDELAPPPGFVLEEDLDGGDPTDWYKTLTEQLRPRSVFYLMAFHQAADGTLTWGSSTELNVADLIQITGEDVGEFLAQPASVQDAFCSNMLAGLCPTEALVIAQVSPAALN